MRSSGNKATLAFAVQGSNDSLQRWIDMLRLSRASDVVTFFLLSYQAPLQCAAYANLDLHCGHAPGSSWGEGRNRLGRMIYRTEQQRNYEFKYWVFTDSDTHSMECGEGCDGMDPASYGARAMCCWDKIFWFLLGHQGFAMVSVSPFYHSQQQWTYVRHQCPDGYVHAFHRAFVPLALPYATIEDERSWFSSSQFLYRVAIPCLPNSFATLGGYWQTYGKNEHAEYPRNMAPYTLEEMGEHLEAEYGQSSPTNVGLYPNTIELPRQQYMEVASAAATNVSISSDPKNASWAAHEP
ncbi:g6655 [Coccomyxa viridis]|uniref:G6655 protein n=1 Tax=Coccomyxa viridis TaxID=1274662 RepID=A0ABP1FVW5_9CHLO